jgi:octaprenyl-diphosphate synthase
LHGSEASAAATGPLMVRPVAWQAALETEGRLTPVEVLALVAEPLAEVEVEFRRNLASEVGLIAEIGRYIADSGGKRLRPALLLLASRACGYEGRKDILYGSVFEFIHTATLVHDDVIDGADTRRGRRSINARWGNNLTVLLGDYLYIRSLSMALSGEDLRVLNLMSDITLRMIEGELIQSHTTGRLDVTEAQYLDIIRRKTGYLFSGCCRTAALLVDREDWVRPLGDYGMSLGVAYQLVDDLLDFTSDASVLGKPVASDLREGRLTLPVIELLARRPSLLPVVRRIVEHPDDCDDAYGMLLQGLREEGCLESIQARAVAEAAQARRALAVLPPSIHRDALVSLAGLLVNRTV